MKFDFDKGWTEAVAMIRGNFALLAAIAGVLVFLPATFAAIVFPEASFEAAIGPTPQPNMEAIQAAVMTLFVQYWWLFALVFLLTSMAQLAMYALLRRRASPTVGEALRAGLTLLPSYIGAYVLQILAIMLPFVMLVSLPAATGLTTVAGVGALAVIPLSIFLVIRLSLTSAVIGIEGERNPLAAIMRSWQLTKGNVLRLLGYFVLLFVAAVVLALLSGWIVGIVFALGGQGVLSFGGALYAGVVDALFAVATVAILAAIHTQLARLSTAERADPWGAGPGA